MKTCVQTTVQYKSGISKSLKGEEEELEQKKNKKIDINLILVVLMAK